VSAPKVYGNDEIYVCSEDGLQRHLAGSGTTAPSDVFEGALCTGKLVTFSFVSPDGSGAFSNALDIAEQAVAEQAIEAWASASGLNFAEVSDGSQADIRIGLGTFNTGTSGVLGYTSYQTNAGAFQPGTIIRMEDPNETALTTDANGQLAYAGTGAEFYQVALHEIGHALGLADNADPNSVMYYASSTANQSLDATDIAEITALYGPATYGALPVAANAAAAPAAGGWSGKGTDLSADHQTGASSTAASRLLQAMAAMEASPSRAASSFVPANIASTPAGVLAAHI
jgi:hypothetical protein